MFELDKLGRGTDRGGGAYATNIERSDDSSDDSMERRSEGGTTWYAQRSKEPSTRWTVRLGNSTPRDLPHSQQFVPSPLCAIVDVSFVKLFARCYGYIMYDRSNKICLINNPLPSDGAKRLARWLDEIRDVETFRAVLTEYFDRVEPIVAKSRNGDDDTANVAEEKTFPGLLYSVRNASYLLNASDELLQRIVDDDKRSRKQCFEFRKVWRSLCSNIITRFEIDEIRVSCNSMTVTTALLKDIILSTALDTRSVPMMNLRMSLLYTFLKSVRDNSDDYGGGPEPRSCRKCLSQNGAIERILRQIERSAFLDSEFNDVAPTRRRETFAIRSSRKQRRTNHHPNYPSTMENETTRRFVLRDTVPVLRPRKMFARSSVLVESNVSYLREFVRCYGFLMYDREAKTKCIETNGPTEEARLVAKWLNDIQDVDTFRVALRALMTRTNDSLDDDVRTNLERDHHSRYENDGSSEEDDDGDERRRLGRPTERTCDFTHLENRCFCEKYRANDGASPPQLDFSSDYERIDATAIRTGPFVSFDAVDRTRQTIDATLDLLSIDRRVEHAIATDRQTRKCAKDRVWHAWCQLETYRSDLDTVMSCVTRDAIVSTALETKHRPIFLWRTGLLSGFLVTQSLTGVNLDADYFDPRNFVKLYCTCFQSEPDRCVCRDRSASHYYITSVENAFDLTLCKIYRSTSPANL